MNKRVEEAQKRANRGIDLSMMLLKEFMKNTAVLTIVQMPCETSEGLEMIVRYSDNEYQYRVTVDRIGARGNIDRDSNLLDHILGDVQGQLDKLTIRKVENKVDNESKV